jgi:hypothetical protein
MAYNYGIDAVPRSGPGNNGLGTNLFVPSTSDNLPTAVICAPVSMTIATGAGGQTHIPVTAFSAGSGVYLINANGNGNNDVQAFGTIIITPAGTISSTTGFTAFNVSPIGAVAGAVSTNPYLGIFLDGVFPTLFQNVSASVVFSVQAIKIANIF